MNKTHALLLHDYQQTLAKSGAALQIPSFVHQSSFKCMYVVCWVIGCILQESPFYFKKDILVLFLHNSYCTSEFPNCGNLVGADCMGNLRWASTEPSMYFRKINTAPSVHFRKGNTDPSLHFRKANKGFLFSVLLQTPNFTSKFTQSFISNITIKLLHHNECNIISQVTGPSYFLCFVHIFLFWSKVASLQFQANGTCRKRPTHRMFAPGGHPSKY